MKQTINGRPGTTQKTKKTKTQKNKKNNSRRNEGDYTTEDPKALEKEHLQLNWGKELRLFR